MTCALGQRQSQQEVEVDAVQVKTEEAMLEEAQTNAAGEARGGASSPRADLSLKRRQAVPQRQSHAKSQNLRRRNRQRQELR